MKSAAAGAADSRASWGAPESAALAAPRAAPGSWSQTLLPSSGLRAAAMGPWTVPLPEQRRQWGPGTSPSPLL